MHALHRTLSKFQGHTGKCEEENREVSKRIDTHHLIENETDAGLS
jgi:hypothetical protein